MSSEWVTPQNEPSGENAETAATEPRPLVRESWFRHARRTFLSDIGGAMAIEFGAVILPFLMLVGAIFQIAILCLTEQVLDSAVGDAARLIRTGQAKSYSQANFNTAVCNGLYSLLDCTKLYSSVKVYTSFAGIGNLSTANASLIDSTGKLVTSGFTFNTGAGSSVVVVQVFYQYPLLMYGFLSGQKLDLADLADGKKLLISTAVFQNEPFP